MSYYCPICEHARRRAPTLKVHACAAELSARIEAIRILQIEIDLISRREAMLAKENEALKERLTLLGKAL